MNLVSIYTRPDRAKVLYDLLAERRPSESISHQGMPTFDEHIRFIQSKPYEAWYFIENGETLGSCYLSKQNEIGVFVFARHRGHGYGKWAVEAIMTKHGKRRYLANINPQNVRSAAMFKTLGFGLLQHTYGRSL